jgi:uncharacterized protein DUF6776
MLEVDGESQGRQASVGLAVLSSGAQREIPYSFRYYQNLEQEISIPAGLRPEHLAVELRSAKKGVAPLSQTFLWNVDAS